MMTVTSDQNWEEIHSTSNTLTGDQIEQLARELATYLDINWETLDYVTRCSYYEAVNLGITAP